MALISPSILSLEFFCKNSFYLRVRLHDRFVNPQLLKQLAVYKVKEALKLYYFFEKKSLSGNLQNLRKKGGVFEKLNNYSRKWYKTR